MGASFERGRVRAGTNGSDFLLSRDVAYTSIEAMRVRGADGVALDPTCLSIAASGRYADAAGSNSKYLVA
ncbi:MAG TPA: hypothetical protein VHE30_10780 [Polyangiaceae bacterium]|nr:hypothetical protein [Polyangiaceae bacterium]